MSQAATLLDLMRPAPIRCPVDPDGRVEPHPREVHQIADGAKRWRNARIQLHPAAGGLWMWATGWGTDDGGGGYQVGQKWGKYAPGRAEALYHAVRELEETLERRGGGSPWARHAIAWARALR